MQLNSMKPAPGSRKKRKRVGRGPGSGHGKTAGRGHKGAGARSGRNVKIGFEGGQMPIARRLPKRGFRNPFRVEYQIVNLCQLDRFEDGAIVDREALEKAGLVKGRRPIKILAKGKLERGLTVRADAFSRAAREAIAAAGGVVEVTSTLRG
ncbi:MAG: 50S ribosomal protein L15 [Candidatus Dadabacteria bacterium]|nr:MAG: 50S ribosomal protein L15 [Candidatus Dadabacteria bacterium]